LQRLLAERPADPTAFCAAYFQELLPAPAPAPASRVSPEFGLPEDVAVAIR
jgi:hypothetical protein